MSFLANLRKKQPEHLSGVQLFYLLKLDGEQIHLALHLWDKFERSMASGQPYPVQITHFVHSPDFLDDEDCDILQTLYSLDRQWQNRSSGFLLKPMRSGEEAATLLGTKLMGLIARILSTGRAYLASDNQSHPNALLAGGAIYLEPCWKLDEKGDQFIFWDLLDDSKENIRVFIFHQGIALYLQENNNRFNLGLAEKRAELAGVPWELTLAAEDTATFIAGEGAHWLAAGLPFPCIVPLVHEVANLLPLLCVQSEWENGQGQGQLQLQFSFVTDRYCSLPGSVGSQHCYWCGDAKVCLTADVKDLSGLANKLTDVLDGFIENPKAGRWRAENDKSWYGLQYQLTEQLNKLGVVLRYEAGFRHRYLKAEGWNIDLAKNNGKTVQVGISVNIDGASLNLCSLLDQLRNFNRQGRQGYAELSLADGRILLLPVDQACNLMEELADFDFNEQGITIPLAQVYRLAHLKESISEAVEWTGESEVIEHAIALHESPPILMKDKPFVKAELRPYQWLGLSWLRHLKLHGANGLLADDMGLGKTLQTLAYLAFEKQQGELTEPALIVLPLSLLHNWASEIRRFTPQLNYLVLHGPKRHVLWKEIPNYDIVLTTYHLLNGDLPRWLEQSFSWLILDEAQAIKNSRTQFSRAVRQFKVDHRLCLSGTPVENHLGELWSIISFLMPGVLGNHERFKQYYQRPIEKQANVHRLQQLLKRVAPFMLRRTKEQIAADLPQKTEICQVIPLDDDQRVFYENIKRSSWQELQQQLAKDEHSGQKRMLALTALLKLRQACCDPAMLGADDITSSKLEFCLERLQELADENRAVLVFSQFTQLLDKLETRLNENNISSLKLTGKTRQRQAVVDKFQSGVASVFLISLKAGGTGLNLTRADTVIIFDPWWNLAAEKQAGDRVHRIGQDKPVFIYKLLCENTIEEKIFELQEKKAQLSAQVDHKAQLNAEGFSVNFEEMLSLWQE